MCAREREGERGPLRARAHGSRGHSRPLSPPSRASEPLPPAAPSPPCASGARPLGAALGVWPRPGARDLIRLPAAALFAPQPLCFFRARAFAFAFDLFDSDSRRAPEIRSHFASFGASTLVLYQVLLARSRDFGISRAPSSAAAIEPASARVRGTLPVRASACAREFTNERIRQRGRLAMCAGAAGLPCLGLDCRGSSGAFRRTRSDEGCADERLGCGPLPRRGAPGFRFARAQRKIFCFFRLRVARRRARF